MSDLDRKLADLEADGRITDETALRIRRFAHFLANVPPRDCTCAASPKPHAHVDEQTLEYCHGADVNPFPDKGLP